MNKPEVWIERHAWAKMYGWCRAATSEVSGYGLCYYQDGHFVVYDAFLPKQYCSSGYTEVDDKANILLQRKLHRWGRDMTHYRFWWHTHYNFSTFWSGTDDRNAEEQVRVNGDWNLALVINQKGDYKCRIDSMRKFGSIIDKVDDLKASLTQNSKKHKRKRNYKSDIKRWVHGMDEMPKSQNDKGLSRLDETTTSKGSCPKPDYSKGNGWVPYHSGQQAWVYAKPEEKPWENWWEGYDYRKDKDIPELNDIVEEKRQIEAPLERVVDSKVDDPVFNYKETKPEEGPAGIEDKKIIPGMTANFGSKKYILHEGKWVRIEIWRQLMRCHCISGNCENCLDAKALEVENERTVQESSQTD